MMLSVLPLVGLLCLQAALARPGTAQNGAGKTDNIKDALNKFLEVFEEKVQEIPEEDKGQAIFRLYDSDNDKQISRSDLMSLLKTYIPTDLTEEEQNTLNKGVNVWFEAMAGKGKETMDYDDFEKFVKRTREEEKKCAQEMDQTQDRK